MATVSDTLNNPVIVKLRSQYLELASREAELSRRLGKDHLAVANLERQIKGVRNSITDELSRIAETYKSEYEIAKQRQTEIEKTVAEAVSRSQDANQASIELRQLESSADSYRAMLKSAFQRNTELVQQQSFPGTEARLITRAATPTSQSSPKTSHYPAGVGIGRNDAWSWVWHSESHAGEGIPHVRTGRGGAPGELHRIGAFAQARQDEQPPRQLRIADDAVSRR